MTEKTITITRAAGTWVIRAAGAVLGESDGALVLHEEGLPDVVYFPRDDIEMAFLEPSDHRTTCPWKGEASHFALVGKSGTIQNAAWSYEDPKAQVDRIRGHVAFYTSEQVTVEQV
ncbi:MAG: DUF427 domain-containing protein [Pseudomonadota bacterium]